jgi:TrmH family RNA methyltransferase
LSDELGPRHGEVKRLRALLRDRRTRADEAAFVLEGPRVVQGALDRGVVLQALYLGPGADVAFEGLVARARLCGVPTAVLREGVLEKVGSTRTPQPVLGVVASIVRPVARVREPGPVVVAVDVADPGNLGTIVRSAEAAGAAAVVVCGKSVDVQNPKVVRSSAGAIFGVPVMEADEPMEVLELLAADGRTRLGTKVAGGAAPDAVDLGSRCAFVVGNEAHGLDERIAAALDGFLTIPMATGAESLNVAMATTVLLFEAARQRRAHEQAPR